MLYVDGTSFFALSSCTQALSFPFSPPPPCLALPYLTKLYLTLPYLTLPYLALPDLTFPHFSLLGGVVRGLDYLRSELGITHGDIKPSNLVTDRNMSCLKICDFGLGGSE